ncbi:dystrotelin [Centroberyx gerrardi]
MDLDSIEGLNEVRPSVYRAAMKLLSLQKLCYMHVVSLRQILPALRLVGGAQNQEVGLSQEEVTQTVNRMFHSVSQEVPGHVTLQAPEQTCSLMYKLYDCDQTGCVSVRSLEVGLIALSADTLSAKYRALVCVAERSSRERGTVRRSGLRSVLQDLSQVPVAVQEEGVFGCVEAAVRSCFNGVLTPSVREEHVLSWLQSEPRLLLWLPTLYRLSVSQNVNHAVRCHSCSTFPITGLRYRCMKCVNLHLCQSCFLTDRQTKKHKTHHPVLEHCTQPTWRESLASLVHSARHALLPRRYTRREAERRRGLMWAEPGETQSSQKASALLKDVRNLQRDKWLLEQELQAWRVAVQSEQGILEDRCSEMEVTMETLRQHNFQLQGMVTQVLSRTETPQHANNTPCRIHTANTPGESDRVEEQRDDLEEEERAVRMKMKLLEAADEVGDSIHNLVSAVSTHTLH